MRRVLLAAAVGTTLVMAAVADDDGVSTVDILAVLEEINEKLDREAPVSSRRAPDSGFGGGPFWPLRYLPGVADLNAYFEQLGSYEAMSEFFIPLKDGGGGTWRWSVDGSLQFGMEYAGFGQDVLGFARHAVDPLGPRDTVDEDGDGYDDYHSYAGYGQRYFAGIAQYKWALAPSLYLQTGIRAGLGFESLRYGMNRRQVLTDRLGITAGANSWTRTSLLGGAYAGLQIGLDGDRNVLKLGIEAGVNGHYALEEWRPETGVHKRIPVPPADVQAHNFWVWIGPQFHY